MDNVNCCKQKKHIFAKERRNDGLTQQMESAVAQLAREYWADHKRDILHNIDDSYLDGNDEFNTEVQF